MSTACGRFCARNHPESLWERSRSTQRRWDSSEQGMRGSPCDGAYKRIAGKASLLMGTGRDHGDRYARNNERRSPPIRRGLQPDGVAQRRRRRKMSVTALLFFSRPAISFPFFAIFFAGRELFSFFFVSGRRSRLCPPNSRGGLGSTSNGKETAPGPANSSPTPFCHDVTMT